VLDQAQVAARRISLEFTRASQPEMLALALATLRRFGVRWPARPSRWRVALTILWTDWKLRGSLSSDAFPAADPARLAQWLAPVIVMGAASPSLGLSGQRLICLVSAYCLRAYRRNGHVGSPALALAGYAGARQIFLRTSKRSRSYAAAAEEWCLLVRHPVQRLRAECTLQRGLYSQTRPRRASLEPLRRIAEAAREAGDVEYVAFALSMRVDHAALVGEPLEQVAELARTLKEFGPHLRGRSWIERALELLIDGHEAPPDDEEVPARGWSATPSRMRRPLTPFWVGTLCMIGAYERAYLAFDAPSLAFEDQRGSDYALFRGLAAAELAAEKGSSPRYRRELARCAQHLSTAARIGPDFVHMALLLSAERARLRRRSARALQLYASAEEAAFKQSYRHHAALILERRAQLLLGLRRETEAATTLRRAIALYEEWGARAKARSLEELLRRVG
jgi:hypothetical protein